MDEVCVLAKTNFRNQEVEFGIKTDDRRRHLYLIGKTGMGKSTVIENMVYQDIMAGRGVCYVDPHGDTVEKILDFIPKRRINDVVYFNPADTDYPIAFNVLEKVDPRYQHLVASGLVGVFKKIWADSWGPRLEYLLRNSILALLEYPDSTLLGVTRIFTDKDYRKQVIARIQDPVVRAFWVDEYSKYPDKFATEAVAPIQNKVGQFLSGALIRNTVGQVHSTFNFRDIMDNKKILLLNLSKGRIGEDNSAMLGAMMITKIQLAAMSRVDTPEEEREDFYLYVDEFQNFATESFAGILSEARKYRLNLTVAHQYIEQLNEDVRAAIFGNVGSILTFRVGAGDAEFLAKEFEPYFIENDLVNLPKWQIYLKLMIDGVASNPFSASTLPPLAESKGHENKIIEVSRERYARPRKYVEDRIMKWAGMDEESMAKRQEVVERKEAKREAKEVEMRERANRPLFKAVCDRCGKDIEVPFAPDGKRPVFCQDCLLEMKETGEDMRKFKTKNKPHKKEQPPKASAPDASSDHVHVARAKKSVDSKSDETQVKKEAPRSQQSSRGTSDENVTPRKDIPQQQSSSPKTSRTPRPKKEDKKHQPFKKAFLQVAIKQGVGTDTVVPDDATVQSKKPQPANKQRHTGKPSPQRSERAPVLPAVSEGSPVPMEVEKKEISLMDLKSLSKQPVAHNKRGTKPARKKNKPQLSPTRPPKPLDPNEVVSFDSES